MSNEVAINGDMHSVIADHYQGLNDALHERDAFAIRNRQLENDIAIAHGLNKGLMEQVASLTKERDYYYRKAYAFESKLRDMKGMIDGVMSLVEFEAEKSPMTVPITAPKLPVAVNLVEGINDVDTGH